MCILSKKFFEEEKDAADKTEKEAVSERVENNEEVVKHLNLSVSLEKPKALDQEQERLF